MSKSEDTTLLDRADATISSGQADVYDRGLTLKDIASKGRKWGLTDGQRRFLYVLVREAEAVPVKGFQQGNDSTPPPDIQTAQDDYDNDELPF